MLGGTAAASPEMPACGRYPVRRCFDNIPHNSALPVAAPQGLSDTDQFTGQRIGIAERLLESGDLPVEQVARHAGFGSAAVLREHFVRERGVAPLAYRRTFRTTAVG